MHQNQHPMGSAVPPPSVPPPPIHQIQYPMGAAVPPPPSVGPAIPPPPPQHTCKVCNVTCASEHSLEQHLNGASHKKRLQQSKGQNAQFHCKICSISCPNEFSLQQHLQGEKHKKRMAVTTTPPVDGNSLMEPLANQFHCALCNASCMNEFSLLQHMSGVKHKTQAAGGSTPVFQCNVCNVKCTSEFNLLQHLSGEMHKTRITEISNSTTSSSGGSSTAVTGQQQSQEQWYCEPCRVGCPSKESYQKHINGKRHKKKIAKRNGEMNDGVIQNAEMIVSSAVNSDSNGMIPQLANSSNDAATLPVAPPQPAVKLESNNDSDEEGEVDEENEDIGNLYDDFSGPQSSPTKQNSEEHAASAHGTKGNDPDNDDDNDMFRGENSNLVNETRPILKKEESENDEADMFDDSDDETGSDEMKSTSLLQKDNVTTLDSGLAFALDYSPDTAPQSESTTNSKSIGISWADFAKTKKGAALLVQDDATVTASKVLAAARERTARSLLKKPRYSSNVDAKKVPNITRPSSLERSYYQQVHPDKFWAELRNWDFLSDLNQAMKSKAAAKKDQDLKKGTKRTLHENNEANTKKACLPDTFESVTQYKALWAPLLIEEAKAQIMSEVVAAQSSPNTSWIQNAHLTKGCEVKAEVSTSARTSSDYEGESSLMEPTVIVRLKRGASIGCQIFPNDLLLFSPTSSAVELALRGIAFEAASKPSSSHLKGRFGFVGRALNHRSGSVDGLLVRVSQKLWTQFSSLNQLFVIKIGSNVTAVREFNALTRVDKLPLNKYLLDGKLHAKQDGQQLEGEVLDELPAGFQTFLKSKANSSQLNAISAAAREYGEGGFTLIKGPPGKFTLCIHSCIMCVACIDVLTLVTGTGKSTTLVSILNALHLRQYQEYYTTIERVATEEDTSETYELLASLNKAAKVKPRILVCAPSNAAIDNVIVKIMSDKFVDGKGSKYSPSIVRVGAGSTNPKVSSVGLKDVVNRIIEEGSDVNKLEEIITNGRRELGRAQQEIQKLRARIRAIVDASPYAISSDWEIRIDEENFEKTGRVFFVNHRHKVSLFLFSGQSPSQSLISTNIVRT